jgi:hypothetical protein
MDCERSQASRGPSLRFTIRGLIVLTTVIAAFFGGRASMQPAIERERDRTNAARLLADRYARLEALRKESQIARARVAEAESKLASYRVVQQQSWRFKMSQGVERAEQQNLRQLQERIKRAELFNAQ